MRLGNITKEQILKAIAETRYSLLGYGFHMDVVDIQRSFLILNQTNNTPIL